MANSARAFLTTHPKEQRVGFVLYHPSAFICPCTIFPLVTFNSSAFLHILPRRPGTWARAARVLWMQRWESVPATVKESYQGQSLAVSFPSVSAAAHGSHLPCLLNLTTTTKIIVFETFTSCRIWWELAKTLLWEGGGKWRWTIRQASSPPHTPHVLGIQTKNTQALEQKYS